MIFQSLLQPPLSELKIIREIIKITRAVIHQGITARKILLQKQDLQTTASDNWIFMVPVNGSVANNFHALRSVHLPCLLCHRGIIQLRYEVRAWRPGIWRPFLK